jgi:hypothetical protein
MPGGELKTRGHFKTTLFSCAVGISSNFGRIFRYMTNTETDMTLVQLYFKELTDHVFEFFLLLRKLLFPTPLAWSFYRVF